MDKMINFNELQRLHLKNVVVLRNDFRLRTPLQEKLLRTAQQVSKEYNYDLLALKLNETIDKSKYNKVVEIDTSSVTQEIERIKNLIKEQNHDEIKNLLGYTLDQDVHIFINEVKKHYNIQTLQEVVVSEERDKFYNGILFKENDVVEESGIIYEVLELGSNYLTVANPSGQISKKWPTDVSVVFNNPSKYKMEERSFIYKGYRADNLSESQIQKYIKLAQETDDPVGLLMQLRMENNSITSEHGIYKIADQNGVVLKEGFKTKESAFNHMFDKLNRPDCEIISESDGIVIALINESEIKITEFTLQQFIDSVDTNSMSAYNLAESYVFNKVAKQLNIGDVPIINNVTLSKITQRIEETYVKHQKST